MQGRKPVPKPLGNIVDLSVVEMRLPPCPETLTEEMQRRCWDNVTRAMVARGIYSEDCHDLVEAYCIQRSRFIMADRKAKTEGPAKQKRYVSESNQAFDRMFRLALELGLSPVMRSRAQPQARIVKGSGFLSVKKDKKSA